MASSGIRTPTCFLHEHMVAFPCFMHCFGSCLLAGRINVYCHMKLASQFKLSQMESVSLKKKKKAECCSSPDRANTAWRLGICSSARDRCHGGTPWCTCLCLGGSGIRYWGAAWAVRLSDYEHHSKRNMARRWGFPPENMAHCGAGSPHHCSCLGIFDAFDSVKEKGKFDWEIWGHIESSSASEI